MTKSIILAAGKGTRLHPYSLNCPKCLVKVKGKSLLDYQISVLRSEGIKQIVLVKGYLSDRLNRAGVITYRNENYAETNMVWTLFCAESELVGDVIVSYGDIAYSKKILHALLQSRYDIAVVIDKAWEAYWSKRFFNPLSDAESLKIGKDGRIIEIGQSPRGLEEIEGQYIGLMKFSETGMSIMRETFKTAVDKGVLGDTTPRNAYMTDLLQAIIDAGHEVRPVFIEGDWIEIDTVSDLNLKITKERLKKISQV